MSRSIIHSPITLGCVALISAFFLYVPSAHAGATVKSTSGVELSQGLVGYWNFDGVDMQLPLDTVSAFVILRLLTPPALIFG